MKVSMFGRMTTSKRLLIALITIAILQLAIELALNGFQSFPDTNEYVETVKWFNDRSGEELPLRIQRPLQIMLILIFEPVLGITNSFILTNCVFYLASVPFFFSFSKKLLKEDRLAFVSTFLFISSFCVLYWGLALLTDMLLWFLLCVSFDLLVDIRERWETKDVYTLALVVGLGMLNKESIMAVAFILIYFFLAKHRLSERENVGKIVRYLPALAAMVIPFIVVQTMMYVYFGPGHTFFDYHVTHAEGDVRGALWYLPVTFAMGFNALLILGIVGLISFFKVVNAFGTKREYAVALALALVPVVAFEQYSPRLAFSIFPFVIPPAALGLKMISRALGGSRSDYLMYLLLGLYFSANNIVSLYGDDVREFLGIWSR